MDFEYVFVRCIVISVQKEIRFNIKFNTLSFGVQFRNDLLYFLFVELNKTEKSKKLPLTSGLTSGGVKW